MPNSKIYDIFQYRKFSMNLNICQVEMQRLFGKMPLSLLIRRFFEKSLYGNAINRMFRTSETFGCISLQAFVNNRPCPLYSPKAMMPSAARRMSLGDALGFLYLRTDLCLRRFVHIPLFTKVCVKTFFFIFQ